MLDTLKADLKTAMLAREQDTVTVLRGLIGAVKDYEINNRGDEITDQVATGILQKEAKKRKEAIDLYTKADDADRANAEKAELAVIEKYLPEMASEDDIAAKVGEVIAEQGADSMQQMGQVIGTVKTAFGGNADGAVIARLVKEALSK